MSAQQSGKAGTLPAGVVSLQGRAYSTWSYTLDTAHGMNAAPLVRFLGIGTAIVQLPTTENGMVAVVHATVTWRNAEGDTVQFQGIGDANPTNCGPVGKSALLRMAEVRAKGRALRDSVNIGDVLEEEMGGDDAPAAQQKPARAQTQRPPLRTANTAAEEDYAAVTALLRADTEGAEKLPKPLGQMTPEELRKTRDWLDRRAAAIKKGRTVWVDPGNLPAGLYRARLAADDIGAAVDPNGAHIVEKAVDEARALLATITASGDKRPHAGDYDQMRTLLLCIQRADPWSGDADPDAIPPAELLPYMRARLAGYETAEVAV